MKIHILLGAAVLALVLLSVEGFPRRGGRHNGHRGRGHNGHHGAGRRRVCNLPPQTGMCYARIPMWFYNSTSEACETFNYGGCGGNANRFWSENACNRRCSDPCSKPLDEGEECGDTSISPKTFYYYDSEEDACKQFEYTGCGGNSNKFKSLNHCERRCMDDSSDSTETLDDNDDEGADEVIDGELDEDVEELLSESDDDDDSSDGDDDTRVRRARRRRPRCHTAMCRLRCPFGQEVLTDENGCVKCRCKEPRCPEVQRCAIFCEHSHEIDPVTGCETCTCKWPEVEVAAVAADIDDDDTAADETDGAVRSLRRFCGDTPRCRMACRHGYQKDEDGCAICRCNPPPSLPEHCRNRPMCKLGCRNGFQTGEDGCPICRCNPPPTSPSLPTRPTIPEHCIGRPMCMMYCATGFQTREDGCPICRCNPRPRPTIPEHCIGRPMCRMYCATGFQTGEDGCPICRCNPPTLDELEINDEELVEGPIEVAAAAGFSTGQGFNEEEEEEEEEEITRTIRRRCHIPRCRMRCRYGYQKDELGCAKCVCNPPPVEPVPEHCQDKPRCYRRCPNGFEVDEEGCPTCRCLPRDPTDLPRPGGDIDSPRRPPACRLLYCFIPCLHGSVPDERGCPTCNCLPAPSTTDDEIEVEDATLEEAETRPAPGTRCVQVRCLRACRYGYERDSNGCQTCVCRAKPGVPARERQRRSLGADLDGEWRRDPQEPRHCKPVLCPMDLRCPFGFARDEQGCQTSCQCREVVRPLPDRRAVCSLPMEVGPCFGAIPRFYFNSAKGECESFRFGGCRGNGNNFRSIEDCRQRCEA